MCGIYRTDLRTSTSHLDGSYRSKKAVGRTEEGGARVVGVGGWSPVST